MNPALRKIIRKIRKIFVGIIISLVSLLLLLYILIQVPAVQNFGRKKIVAYLEKKLQTKVSIEKLSLDFPKRLVLENIYIEDRKKDTLLVSEKLRVDISLFKLFQNKVELNYLELSGVYANLQRLQPDSVFNFDFIAKAFTNDQQKKDIPSDSASRMIFDLKKIVLSRIRTSFKDDQTGNDANFYLGYFETGFKSFDPFASVFDLPKITVNGIKATVRQYKPLMQSNSTDTTTATSNGPINTVLRLKDVQFQNIFFTYDNNISQLSARIRLHNLHTDIEHIDLQKMTIQLAKAQLDSTSLQIALGKSQQALTVVKETKKEVATQINNPWNITCASLVFNDNELQFDNNNRPKLSKGIDYNHLHVSDFTIHANALNFSPEGLNGDIRQLTFHEQSGFNLKQMQTTFSNAEKESYLKDFVLLTDRSLIKNNIHIKYPSLTALADHPEKTYIDFTADHSTVAVKDILSIMPSLSSMPPFKNNYNTVFKLHGSIRGYLNNIEIPFLQCSGMSGTNFTLSGSIKGLPDIKKTSLDIIISQFRSNKNDLSSLIPAQSLSNIRIPESIALKGTIKSNLNNTNVNLHIVSSRGNANIFGKLNTNNNTYDFHTAFTNIDLGYLLKKDSLLHTASADLSLKGNGFNLKTSNISLEGKIHSFYLKGYNYTNGRILANKRDGIIAADAKMNDKNIAFNLHTTADITAATSPTDVKLNISIDTLNLQALNLINKTYALKGKITANFPVANPDSLIGNFSISNLMLNDSGRLYKTDSILLVATAFDNERTISFSSEMLQLTMKGRFHLAGIPTALKQTIHRYYALPEMKDTILSPQELSLQAKIIPSPIILWMAPQIRGTDTGYLDIAFNNIEKKLNINGGVPKIIIGEQKVDSLQLKMEATSDKLEYNATINSAGNKEFYVYKTSLTGNISNNIIYTNFDINGKNNQPKYQLSATINNIRKGMRLHINPDLLLNYQKWIVSNDNFIQYDSTGLLVNHLSISNQKQSFTVRNTSQVPAAPLEIKFGNFEIATLTSIAEQKELLLNGAINGNAIVNKALSTPTFIADLSISDLSYKNDTIGNMLLQVNNQSPNIYNANVKVEGNGNNIQLTGTYNNDPVQKNQININTYINSLNLSSIKKFSNEQLSDAGGNLKGNISVKGTAKQPQLDGTLSFEKGYIIPTLLGEKFYLSEEPVIIRPDAISFNNFSLTDSAGNKAYIAGNIQNKNFSLFQFDMDIKADDFRAVNSKPAASKIFYGQLNLDIDTHISGTVSTPTVKGTIKVNTPTDFTVVLPTANPEVSTREGVVKFIDYDTQKVTMQSPIADAIVAQTELKGIDMAINVETDTAAQFTMIIDERNGDALKLKGDADIAATMDRSGKLSLTGNYKVQGGSYQLTFNLLTRKFDIQKGSIITWTGSPTKADVNVTAVYAVKTAPIDLVQSQLSGKTQKEINTYKQNISFNVYLKITGELLKPIISFDVRLTDEDTSQWKEVAGKLEQIRRDEAEINKQVFALLLLGRFVSENPFQSAGPGMTAENMVRQSASRILTDQLNQLAAGIIKGIDLNFGIESGEDYATGEKQNRTDLNVGISKRLLNDRLKITVGSNFELEGRQNTNQSASNIAGDVAIDYQLTKDGRYMIRAYRKNKYQGVIEGQVVETGASFLFTLDYDQFKELFSKNPSVNKKKQKSIQQKQPEKKSDSSIHPLP